MPINFEKLGFKKTNITIDFNENGLVYNINLKKDSDFASPGIYLVVAKAQNRQEIIYIGKAGAGINKRFREHVGGYNRRKKKGGGWKSNIELSIEKLSQGFKKVEIEVWYRHSTVKKLTEIFPSDCFTNNPSEIDVSCFSLEEEALLGYFNSLGNQKFLTNTGHYPPKIIKPNGSQPKEDWQASLM